MSDAEDELLAALGKRQRELQAEREAAWAAVLMGQRSADEVAAERAAAGDSPEDIEAARALHTPGDAARRDAAIDAVVGTPRPRKATTDARVRDDRRRWIVGGFMLAAAVVLLLFLLPRPREHEQLVAALPSYTLEIDGGLASTRAEPAKPEPGELPRYRANTLITWTMRAEVEVEGELATEMFAISEHEQRELDLGPPALRVHPTGTVSLSIAAGELGLQPGEWTIIWAVGRPDALPNDATAANQLQTTPDVAVSRVAIIIDE